MEGSNAADWWRYEGVRAARAFASASNIEPTDDIAGIGDGVTKRVYEYSNARSRTTGSQTTARFFVLNSANSSPLGLADPPVLTLGEPSDAPADARSSATAETTFATTYWTRSQSNSTMIVADESREGEPECEPTIEKKKSNGRWPLPMRSFSHTPKRSPRRRTRR